METQKYLVAKRISVEPHMYLAISHETGLVIAEGESLEDLHKFCNAHGWAYEEM